MKKLGEVFNDYESGGTIRCAEIEKVTLRKKSKALELKITSNQYIEIKEIERFNNFLKERFLLNDAKVLIKYTKDVNKKPIEEEIKEIVRALSMKHPFLRGAIKTCEYEIKDRNINLIFKLEISHFYLYVKKLRNRL